MTSNWFQLSFPVNNFAFLLNHFFSCSINHIQVRVKERRVFWGGCNLTSPTWWFETPLPAVCRHFCTLLFTFHTLHTLLSLHTLHTSHTPFYFAHFPHFCTRLFSFLPISSVTPFAEFGCKVLRRCWWLAHQITCFMIASWVSVVVMNYHHLCGNWYVFLKGGFWWIRKLGILLM